MEVRRDHGPRPQRDPLPDLDQLQQQGSGGGEEQETSGDIRAFLPRFNELDHAIVEEGGVLQGVQGVGNGLLNNRPPPSDQAISPTHVNDAYLEDSNAPVHENGYHDNPNNPAAAALCEQDYPYSQGIDDDNWTSRLTMKRRVHPLHEESRPRDFHVISATSSSASDNPRTSNYYDNDRPIPPYWDTSAPSFSRSYQQQSERRRTSSYVLQQQQPRRAQQQIRLQVAPGLSLRLQGAVETKEAIDKDFFLPAMCLSCRLDLYCIQDANYVVCPRCRVVTPMEGMFEGFDGGVGLGFTHDDLCRRQCEILYGGSHGVGCSSSTIRNGVGVDVVIR